jgi:hypothetical protein
VRIFDRRFGADLLAGVPEAPGVYRFLDDVGVVLYVGKAANLRRRLSQYRTAGRRKAHRKRRAIVQGAARVEWEVCESELAASLAEIRLIQALRPPRNVVSAFPFLYPYIGIRTGGTAGETYFCLTTSPGAFPSFAFHGAFRTRDVTREAFYSLARLLRWAGHPVPRHHCRKLEVAPHSRVVGFRRLAADASAHWARLLEGASRDPLEALALRLLEHPGARVKRREIHEDLKAVARFFKREAQALARARAATGYARYPVPQEDRDLLFAEFRHVPRAGSAEPARPAPRAASTRPASPKRRASAGTKTSAALAVEARHPTSAARALALAPTMSPGPMTAAGREPSAAPAAG